MAELAPAERRPARRKKVLLSGTIASADGSKTFDCAIKDLTAEGGRVALRSHSLVENNSYLLNIRDRTAHQFKVAWRSQTEAGLVFTQTIPLGSALEPGHLFLKQLWLAKATR
jgi:hypothetical protein